MSAGIQYCISEHFLPSSVYIAIAAWTRHRLTFYSITSKIRLDAWVKLYLERNGLPLYMIAFVVITSYRRDHPNIPRRVFNDRKGERLRNFAKDL